MSEHGREIIQVADMVISATQEDDEMPLYQCRNLDTRSGRCTVYDSRPKMCRDYPEYVGGYSCIHCGVCDTPKVQPLQQAEG